MRVRAGAKEQTRKGASDSNRRRRFSRTVLPGPALGAARTVPGDRGWVGGDLHTGIFEVREDEEKGEEYYHLVTLWKATKQEQKLYAEHS
jgi:hypothetical protein